MKKTKFKRFTAGLTAAAMLLGVTPMNVFAEGDEGPKQPKLRDRDYDVSVPISTQSISLYSYDNDYTFKQLLVDGEPLELEYDYKVWGSEKWISGALLTSLGTGTHKFTFDYEEEDAIDPVATVTLTQGDIANVDLSSYNMPSTIFYMGEPIEPTYALGYNLSVSDWVHNRPLLEGKDYTVKFENNVNAGTATVTFTGMGDYTGTKTATFKINPMPLGSGGQGFVDVEFPDGIVYAYTGEEIKPRAVVLFNGEPLTEGVDYTLEYKGELVEPSTTSLLTGMGYVQINGIGNYSSYATPYSGQFRIMKLPSEETSGEIGGISWTLDTEGTLTISGDGTLTALHNELDRSQVRKIVVNEGIKIIESLTDYPNATEIILPEGLKEIYGNGWGIGALGNQFSCRDLVIPDSVESIGQNALSQILGFVHLPDNLNTYGYNGSRYYERLSRILVKRGTKTEELVRDRGADYCIEGYSDFILKKGSDGLVWLISYQGKGGDVVVPDFVDAVDSVFQYGNCAYSSITIPGSVSKISSSFASGMYGKTITILPGDKLTELPENLLRDCCDVTLDIPDNVTSIGGKSLCLRNHTLIVGKGSYAEQWCKDNGYKLDNERLGWGKCYRLRGVEQPTVTPQTGNIKTDAMADFSVAKNDGSFTFDSLYNGNEKLTEGEEYALVGNALVIRQAYLEKIGPGNYTFKFHYTGTAGEDNENPIDPMLSLTITKMAGPAVTVKGFEDADVTENCTVVWKDGSGSAVKGNVISGTRLYYTASPTDALKIDGVQYYKETAGSEQLTELAQPVEIKLGQQGTVTVTPKDGENDIPVDDNAGYKVTWYNSNGYYMSEGVTSPMTDAGSVLYCTVTMTGKNAENYPNIVKSPVAVEFGSKAVDINVKAKNNITLNITGSKRSGGDITSEDYRIYWYTKNDKGEYKWAPLSGTKLTNLAGAVGSEYYYEIVPADRSGAYSWLEFHGVPISEGRKVTVTEDVQTVNIELTPVTMTELNGKVTNAASVGADNLTLSLTQDPSVGYDHKSYYSYADIWNSISITKGANGSFSANVYDLETTVKAEDKLGNYQTAFRSAPADGLTGLKLTLAANRLPDSLGLIINRTYPETNDDGFAVKNLYKSGSPDTEGLFPDMRFTLTNDTKGTVIDPALYTVSVDSVRFPDVGALDGIIDMSDKLTLSVTLTDDAQGSMTSASSQLSVSRRYADTNNTFVLSYKEYGKAHITTERSGYRDRETAAIYDENGELVDCGTIGSDSGIKTISLAPGTYTAVVWRRADWLDAPSTLSFLEELLPEAERQTKRFTVSYGKMTEVKLGASPEVKTKLILFDESTGFKDETVNGSINEWVLVGYDYKIDPHTAALNPDDTYALTVRIVQDNGHTKDQYMLVRTQEDHEYSKASKDKYISLYSGGKKVDADVKVLQVDTYHLGNIKGFTLYTDKTEGTIWFYVQASKGGEFPITASGVRLNKSGNQLQQGAGGSMTFSVSAQNSGLSFASDYLRTSDNSNGKGNTYSNGVWLTTIPYSTVTLYMDGIAIATGRSQYNGYASFAFTMNSEKIATVNTKEFYAIEDWSLAGAHEIYAETETEDGVIRSATAIKYCVTKESFTPAVLKKVNVTCYSDNEWDNFSGTGMDLMNYYSEFASSAPSLSSYYYSLNSKGSKFTYKFTATVEDPETVREGDGLILFVTGQDGTEYAQIMERTEGKNEFTATVSGEKLIFTRWGIAIRSKIPETVKTTMQSGSEYALIALDDIDLTELLDSETVLTSDDGSKTTLGEYYSKAKTEAGKLTEEQIREELMFELDVYNEFFKSLEPVLGPMNFELDGSDESMQKLLAYLGCSIGTAADVDYESWDNLGYLESRILGSNGSTAEGDLVSAKLTDGCEVRNNGAYVSAKLANGRELRSRVETHRDKNGHLIYTSYSVLLPTADDPDGYSVVQTFDMGTVDYYAYSYCGYDMLIGRRLRSSGIPAFSNGTGSAMESTNRALQNAYKKLAGHESSSSWMAGNARQRLLSEGRESQYSERRRQSMGMNNMQRNINDLLDLPNLPESTRNSLSQAKQELDDASSTSTYSQWGSVVNNVLSGAMSVKTALDSLGKGAEGLFGDMAKNATAEKFKNDYGVDVPTSLFDAFSKLTELYINNAMSEAERKAYEAMILINSALRDAGVSTGREPGESWGGSTCGGTARATHDPEGIVYEAVLSNPVEGATLTLYERSEDGAESVWNAAEFGQINPQITNASGWYQWYVPEGEWQVRVKAPDGSDLADNTSADNSAANLDDGSTKGWLPVMPVQMGINIPLVSTKSPAADKTAFEDGKLTVTFSMYMDISTLTDKTVIVLSGGRPVECTITFPDAEKDPADETRTYAKTMVLVPADGFGFDRGVDHVISITEAAKAYNGKALTGYEKTVRIETEAQSVADAEVTLSETVYAYDGTAKRPDITVTLGGRTLAEGTDYVLTYSNNTDMGQATVTVKGRGDYSGNVSVSYDIFGGDVDGNGKIDQTDLALLQQYLAGWNVKIDLKLANVNEDQAVNGADVALLQQYFAGWNVKLYAA